MRPPLEYKKAADVGAVMLHPRARSVMIRENILTQLCFAIVAGLIGRVGEIGINTGALYANLQLSPAPLAKRYPYQL